MKDPWTPPLCVRTLTALVAVPPNGHNHHVRGIGAATDGGTNLDHSPSIRIRLTDTKTGQAVGPAVTKDARDTHFVDVQISLEVEGLLAVVLQVEFPVHLDHHWLASCCLVDVCERRQTDLFAARHGLAAPSVPTQNPILVAVKALSGCAHGGIGVTQHSRSITIHLSAP